MYLGESFIGEGAEAAHLNVVVGTRDGAVGTAWATGLATPSAGHAPFVVVAQPGLPVQPFTLFVNKAAIASPQHGRLTWGAAQAGVAGGVIDALAGGILADPAESVCIAAVWVDPMAQDEAAVYANNREATYRALAAAMVGLPDPADVLASRDQVWNPFFRPAPGPPGATAR